MFKGILKFGAVQILVAAFGASDAMAQSGASDAQILHFLNRISFGPAPGDIQAVKRMGIDAYLDRQLHPGNIAMPDELENRLEQLPTVNASITDLALAYGPPAGGKKELSPEERKALEQRQRIIVEELAQAKILRAVANPAQLQEVMVDFWFNHFNVFFGKGADKVFVSSYERDAIRPYVFGKFRDLLGATTRHPAMLFYLDNWENTDPNSPFAQKAAMRQGKQIGINENYARELMELHTLGVNGGYTQGDVTTLAHILTGWGLERGQGIESKASFEFDGNRHDWDSKIFLGGKFEGGGEDEIERVLDLLARHPSTAHHIAYELAQYFVADQPPESLVTKLADVFKRSDGDIATVLRALFASPEFWDAKYYNAKFKPPFRYVVSTLRVSGIFPPGDTRKMQGAIGQMGEPLYRCQTPNGYSNTNDQWLNSDAVLKRINFAQALAEFADANAPQMIESALGNNWSANTLNTVAKRN